MKMECHSETYTHHMSTNSYIICLKERSKTI